MDLFIIRHGQSANNSLPDIRDREVDPPLTDLGERQAELLAEHLASGETHDRITADTGNTRYQMREGYGITALFTSPMYRSLQTVQPIAKSLGLAPKIWVDIHEEGGMYLNHGGDEGLVGYPVGPGPKYCPSSPTTICLQVSMTPDGGTRAMKTRHLYW